MRRTTVSSQIIASIGYDIERCRLEVEFRNGWIYEYDDVPTVVHNGLMTASSHGRFLKQYIVDTYVTRRIR